MGLTVWNCWVGSMRPICDILASVLAKSYCRRQQNKKPETPNKMFPPIPHQPRPGLEPPRVDLQHHPHACPQTKLHLHLGIPGVWATGSIPALGGQDAGLKFEGIGRLCEEDDSQGYQ